MEGNGAGALASHRSWREMWVPFVWAFFQKLPLIFYIFISMQIL